MQVETLLRRSIREKPASKRSARQKTSTPRDMVRMNLNENAYGMSDTVQQALRASVADNSMYQDFYAYDIRKKVADLHGLTADHILIGYFGVLLVYDLAVLVIEFLSRSVFQPSGDGQRLVLEEDAEFGGGHGILHCGHSIESAEEDCA